MARNKVQFQKGLSEAAFDALYGTEEKCRAAVIASRWPNGFECPACGGRAYCEVRSRGLFQCNACRRQTSPIAGTIFASTHVPLRLWFRAMYHLTQSKQGIASVELGRRLGVTQTTAWKIKHKLAQVMMERDATKQLSGRVELDDAYLGGERTGGKRGRGAPGKTPFVAAVETTPEGKPAVTPAPGRQLLQSCNFDFCQAQPRSILRGRQRWLGLFRRRDHGRVSPRGHHNRLRRCRGSHPRVQMGQYGTRQHQGRHRWDLPGDRPKTRTAVPGRVRISLQPAIRSCRHDAAASLGRCPHHTHALPVAQAGRCLCLIRTTAIRKIG